MSTQEFSHVSSNINIVQTLLYYKLFIYYLYYIKVKLGDNSMSGTKVGGLRAADANKERYGSDFYVKIGSTGGKAKVPKGFSMNRELASTAGTIGGGMPRRKTKRS